MSKFDEITDEVFHILTQTRANLTDKLKSLKPYIELAELMISHEKEHDYIYSGMTDNMFENEQEKWYELITAHNDRRTRINELINQIKEANNEGN